MLAAFLELPAHRFFTQCPKSTANPKLFSLSASANPGSTKLLAVLSLSLAIGFASNQRAFGDQPLQGNVQEMGASESPANLAPIVPMSAPVLKKRKPLAADAQDNSLKGNAEDSGHGLSGQAQDEGDAPMKSQKAPLMAVGH